MKNFRILISIALVSTLISCNTEKDNTSSVNQKTTPTLNDIEGKSDKTEKVNEVKQEGNRVIEDSFSKTKILFFEDYVNQLYTYKLEVNGNKAKLTYTVGKYEPIVEIGRFEYRKGDYKIIINGCDDCYKLVSTSCNECRPYWHLSVYNPETDGHDLFEFVEDKSNCLVGDLFQ
jgi:hypothetical protein